MQTMKLLKSKHLLVNLKTIKEKKRDNEIKELEDEIRKLKLQSTNLSVKNKVNDKK